MRPSVEVPLNKIHLIIRKSSLPEQVKKRLIELYNTKLLNKTRGYHRYSSYRIFTHYDLINYSSTWDMTDEGHDFWCKYAMNYESIPLNLSLYKKITDL